MTFESLKEVCDKINVTFKGGLLYYHKDRLTYSVALSARPRKSIPFRSPAAIPPPAALCKERLWTVLTLLQRFIKA